ncbi:hypothetical protein [Tranquillimonas alkanivorans]|uniref:Uncharacterized protein n=1 Tax=Tranquillimonas alkanivorans TaxID=441119 RepID=A0A1I5TU95_9RHOB|nr:hypothetical protein [Tranquillimonas alkanivorans]SFP86167.1 hypothetical protein SAMN04488047_11511 [Tranquillimonas alkanivorans]
MTTQDQSNEQTYTPEECGHSLSPRVFRAAIADIINEFGALRREDEPVQEVLLNDGHAYEMGSRAMAYIRELEAD